MFGYVRPVLNRLSEDDRAAYQSAYCGLCRAMGRRYGWLARFTLNYDFAFLAILLSGGQGGGNTCSARCPAHPLRAPRTCLCGPGLDVAADESMILTYQKLTDDVCDHGVLSGPAIERLEKSVIDQVVFLDTINIPADKMLKKFKVLSTADIFSRAIDTIYMDKPMSRLYD